MGQRIAKTFEEQYPVGLLFERWLATELSLTLVDNIQWQTECGDTSCYREIKYDRMRHQTRRLFIETHEAHNEGGAWHEAAITQKAKWLLIGDCSVVWEFDQKTILDQLSKRTLIELPRAKGFLMQEYTAEFRSMRKLTFSNPPLMLEQ